MYKKSKLLEEYPYQHITDLEDLKGIKLKYPPILVNIRGCNGAGKSTAPLMLMDDPDLYLLTWFWEDMIRPFATVFPSYNCIAMGTYFNKTGGLDTYRNNEQTRVALELLWNLPYNIIMEGVISSTVYSTYAALFKEFLESPKLSKSRELVIANLLPPVEVCLERIQIRNGGKEINEKAVVGKWETVNKNATKFADDGFNSLKLDNSEIIKEDTLEWWNGKIEEAAGNTLFYLEGN